MTDLVLPGEVAGGIRLDYPPPPPGVPLGPNRRQALAHRLARHTDELLFGGARGGGKTDWLLAEAMVRLHRVPGMQGVIFRRTNKELTGPSGIIQRLLARVPKHVAVWRASEKQWRFRNGSTLTLSYLETIEDVRAWLGLELQFMGFDQLEQLEEETYILVRTSLRAAGELAGRMRAAGYRPSSAATANPGDIGHAWVKARFIDPFPLGDQLFRASPTEHEPTPMVRCFVRSLLSDNPALDLADPSYRARLEALPADERKAHLEGDWNVFKGARFAMFRTATHVVEPEAVPIPAGAGIPRARGIDYGQEQPFVCLWGARLADDLVVIYREVAAEGLSAGEQARAILAATSDEEEGPGRSLPSALDPACWTPPADQPPPKRMPGEVGSRRERPPKGSIAWTYEQAGLPVRRADNRRLEGWAAVADRLKPRPDGSVRLLIYSTCPGLIRTLPALQRDPKRPEDVLKASIDHWGDALRYLLGVLGFLSAPSEGQPAPGSTRKGPLAPIAGATGVPGRGRGLPRMPRRPKGIRGAGF